MPTATVYATNTKPKVHAHKAKISLTKTEMASATTVVPQENATGPVAEKATAAEKAMAADKATVADKGTVAEKASRKGMDAARANIAMDVQSKAMHRQTSLKSKYQHNNEVKICLTDGIF